MPAACWADRLHHALQLGAAALLLGLAARHRPDGGAAAIALALAAGWATVSFAEYGLHRWVMHGRSRFAMLHAQHHAAPRGAPQFDVLSLGAPFALYGLAWALVALAAGAAAAHAFVAGSLLRYAWFRWLHRAMHDGRAPARLRWRAARHRLHHARPGCHYGVATGFWDWLFATDTSPHDTAGDPMPREDRPRGAVERLALPLLRDTRDLAFVRLTLRAALLLGPALVLLFRLPPAGVALLALPYLWLLYAVFGGPLMLMVHAVFHRRSVTRRGRPLEIVIRHGLPLLYGIPPGAYFPQHVLMHHRENNGWHDLSGTRRFRRDSPAAFLRYWLRFMTIDTLRLPGYLIGKGRRRDAVLLLAGHAGFVLLVLVAWRVSWAATLLTLLLPYVMTRFFLMAGNWAQHAFIDPAAPAGQPDATVLLNSPHNRRCFNDGFHALHHRHPGLHWAEMAARFHADRAAYAARGTIVFDGIANNQVVWWCLMRGDLRRLAAHLSPADGAPADLDARIALLRERLQPLPRPAAER